MNSNYGIQLIPLDMESAMLVRNWRNKEEVKSYMDFKGNITEELQKKWFKEINEKGDYYFIIEKDKTKIGLIHLNRFNVNKTTAYAGLFIGESKFLGTGVTLAASILLLDFAFNDLKLEKVFAKVHPNNKSAIQYNESLGFQRFSIENKFFLKLSLKKKVYQKKRKILSQFLPTQ